MNSSPPREAILAGCERCQFLHQPHRHTVDSMVVKKLKSTSDPTQQRC